MRAVIDIGSNSVRLMFEGVKLKDTRTTRLSEGLNASGLLSEPAMERTLIQIVELYNKAIQAGAEEVFAFATEAVRAADNGKMFVDRVKSATGLKVDVVSGEQEALFGFVGAAAGKMGLDLAVVDIGGASVEIATGKNGIIAHSISKPIGVVRLREMFGMNKAQCCQYIQDTLKHYPKRLEGATFVGIGGTFSSAAAVLLGLEEYDPYKVDGYIIKRDIISALNDRLWAMTDEQRALELKVLNPKRAEVIHYGTQLIECISEYYLSEIEVSESDNLEGYLMAKDFQS